MRSDATVSANGTPSATIKRAASPNYSRSFSAKSGAPVDPSRAPRPAIANLRRGLPWRIRPGEPGQALGLG